MNGTNASINAQVITFQQIANAHGQINDFYAGRFEDMNALQHQYPLLAIDLVDMTEYEMYTDYVWRVYISDLIKVGNNGQGVQSYVNEFEVLSDARRIIKDILLIIRDSFDLQIEWGKTKSIPKVEDSADNLAGVWMDVTISIPDDTALDQVPLKS